MANLNLSQFGENTSVSDADYTFVWDSANSISKKVTRNSWLTSPSLSTSAPVTISQTWDAGTNVMTALKVVATDTASGVTSNLLELWAGSTPALDFAVTKAGAIQAYGTYSAAGVNYARLALACDSSGNATIATQAAGSGVAGTVSINGIPMRSRSGGDIVMGINAAATTTGGYNVYIGVNAGGSTTTGGYNVCLGTNAVVNETSNNTVIGAGAAAIGGVGANNQVVIGNNATGLGLNSVVLGNNSITKTALKGNVGIGTTSPSSNLTVAQGTAGVGTISVGAAETTITGVGTQFLNTFAVGQTITSAGQTLTISAIASDTSMTISPAAGAAISGQPYTLVGGTRFSVAGHGDIEVNTASSGLILKSPDGTRYRVTVPNGGTVLTITAV